MEMKVRLTLSIGKGGTIEDEEIIDLPDNFRELPYAEREECMNAAWEYWASNFIDGGISEIPNDEDYPRQQ